MLLRAYIVDPMKILTQSEPLESVIEAYQVFDIRQSRWIKVKLEPSARMAASSARDGVRPWAKSRS